MKCIVFVGFFWLCACGVTTSSGGAVADVQASDVQIDDSDAAGSDAVSDSLSDGSDTTKPCNDKVGFHCCKAGADDGVPTCVNGSFQCPSGDGQMALGQACGDDTGPDTADTDDAGCPAIPMPLTCCCDGDVTTGIICSAGAWTCPKGYGMFTGAQCNGSVCGGPCSLPCPMDVIDTSDVPSDTAQEDTPHDDGGSAAATLCTSTGGTVYTGKCCTAASDFPDECGIGGCTCAPAYLKDIQRCNCGSGKCFKSATGCN